MKKKATLLIKNLETIYTLHHTGKRPSLIHHGFIAIHHDKIMEVGEGDFLSLVDKDTRIIDGGEHYAVPGFIESDLQMKVDYAYTCMREQLTRFQGNARLGVLNTNITMIPSQQHRCESYYFELHEQEKNSLYPIVYAKQLLRENSVFHRQRFCLSSYDATFEGDDMLLLARLLKLRYQLDDMVLLKAMTRYPAYELGLRHLGGIQAGLQADVLIMRGLDITTLYTSFDPYTISHVIKKGVRVFPNILI